VTGDFIETLLDAKHKAEEEYKNSELKEFRPIIYEGQLVNLRAFGLHENVELWVREHFEVIPDPVIYPHDIISKINSAVRAEHLDRLGSQLHELRTRMAKNTEVPKLRGLSYGPHSVVFDEAHCITEIDSGSAHWSGIPESDSVQLKEWLQRRGICRRTLPCGIP
jgi:hypothetical protein